MAPTWPDRVFLIPSTLTFQGAFVSPLDPQQILIEAGLLSDQASADLRARVAGLSTEEVQHVLSTRTRIEQGQRKLESVILITI